MKKRGLAALLPLALLLGAVPAAFAEEAEAGTAPETAQTDEAETGDPAAGRR